MPRTDDMRKTYIENRIGYRVERRDISIEGSIEGRRLCYPLCLRG